MDEQGTVIRVLVLDAEAIFSKHHMAALNAPPGTACDYWRAAMDEVLALAGVRLEAPAAADVEESATLKSAVELATAKMEGA